MKLTEGQIKIEFGRSAPEAQQRPPLRIKYRILRPAKFGGKKMRASNSGNVGRAVRRRARCLLGPGRGLR